MSYVSVDHERAGQRAAMKVATYHFANKCQSIMSALASAPAAPQHPSPPGPVSVDHERAGQRAEGVIIPVVEFLVVSVDHERAGQRAPHLPAFNSAAASGVSRS